MKRDMREGSVVCLHPGGTHRMAWTEWGDAANPCVLICAHSLTRVGRDFDELAKALCDEYRVICPDVVGRGRSDWLPNGSLYTLPQYCADMLTLIATIAPRELFWLGTSMGGLIGMGLASQALTSIRKLVLNDIGPVLTREFLGRVDQYIGKSPRFDDMAAAENYMRRIYASFGEHTEAGWLQLTRHAVMRDSDGSYRLRYDPAIADNFSMALATGMDFNLWPFYDMIRCPTLVLRGAQSDLLTPDIAAAMTRRGPHATLVEIQNVGHAPTLMDAMQISIVRNFLAA
ncbi:MAG TPA: alpha/beta hydrolase [Rhodocyclaceae bacterium]|nr:alpha/beta hydrolase [Rhodocyclaceae bacterium]